MFYRDTWAEINLSNIAANIQTIQKTAGKAFFAVIKANGYGCGDKAMAETAVAAGAALLAVSCLDEALALRKQGIESPILVLGYVRPAALPVARNHRIAVVAPSLDWAKAVPAEAAGLAVHIKVDTGMNRLGFATAAEIQQALGDFAAKGLVAEGICTHFACSDEASNDCCEAQLGRFKAVFAALNQPFRWIHCANTDAALHFPEDISNAVRCGIGMLGVSAFGESLLPAVELYSRLVHVRLVPQGESIGYGAAYTTKRDEWIGTIPIGYADGWIRRHQGRNCVVEGHLCEFVGRICMDQAMIRLPKPFPIGAKAQLIGPAMPVTQVAGELDTIPYEIFTTLGPRIARVYLGSEKLT